MKRIHFFVVAICVLGIVSSAQAGAPPKTRIIFYGDEITTNLDRGEVHEWAFDGRSGDIITISMESNDFDTYLELYDPTGKRVAADDDSGSHSNAKIESYLLKKTGEYIIVATGHKNSASGRYTIKLSSANAHSDRNLSGGAEIEAAVQQYWAYISDHQWDAAWKRLTPSFKERMHDGSYQDYVTGYEAMQICSVSTDDIHLVESTGEFAVVSASVIYKNRDNCYRSVYKFDHFMVYDPSNEIWLLEGVAVREDGVTDKHISQTLQIQSQVQNGELSKDQAEYKLENIYAEAGKDAFAWIVRHVPVYDPDTGWHTFDDWVKDFAQSSGSDPDARITQDPVGVGVDIFFGNPSVDQMLEWFGFDY